MCHPAPEAREGEAPATGRDIKALDLADETWDPASIHPYDGPVPLAARSDLVGSVCCQRLEVTWPSTLKFLYLHLSERDNKI